MPEPVSVTVGMLVSCAALAVHARPSSAVSAEAGAVVETASALVESTERSQVLFGGKAAAISELLAMANECAEPDWDGDSAKEVNPVAVAVAKDFLRALPEDLPMPEFAPEPDGSVSLDWIQARHRLFSLSVNGSNRLAYAWVDGTDKGHAVARFDGVSIPLRVLQGIRSIASHADTSFRTA